MSEKERKYLLSRAVALSVLSVLFLFGATTILAASYFETQQAIDHHSPWFRHSTASAALVGVWLIVIGMLAYGIVGVLIGLQGKRLRESVSDKVFKVNAILMIVGLGSIIVLTPLINVAWSHLFENEGYVRCGNSFLLTSRYFEGVWVRDERLCFEPVFRSVVRGRT